jgi:uncharacterized protein (TIGR03382 family)
MIYRWGSSGVPAMHHNPAAEGGNASFLAQAVAKLLAWLFGRRRMQMFGTIFASIPNCHLPKCRDRNHVRELERNWSFHFVTNFHHQHFYWIKTKIIWPQL